MDEKRLLENLKRIAEVEPAAGEAERLIREVRRELTEEQEVVRVGGSGRWRRVRVAAAVLATAAGLALMVKVGTELLKQRPEVVKPTEKVAVVVHTAGSRTIAEAVRQARMRGDFEAIFKIYERSSGGGKVRTESSRRAELMAELTRKTQERRPL